MVRRGLIRAHPSAMLLFKRLIDLLLVLGCGLAAHAALSGQWRVDQHMRELMLCTLIISSVLFDVVGLYRSTRGARFSGEIERLALVWSVMFSSYLFAGWIIAPTPLTNEAMWAPLTASAAFTSMVVVRLLMSRLLGTLRERGYNRKRIAIAVASELGLQVCERLRSQPGLGFDVVGYIDDRSLDRLTMPEGIPLLGTVDDISDCVQRHDLDQVWMALPFRAEERIRHILGELRHSTVDIRLVPDVFQFFLLNQSLEEIGGIPVHTLTASPMQGANRLLKAAEDRVLAALILLLISPLMLAVALAVRLSSPGPVIFKQRRHGWNGKTIEVWKFRTMKLHDAPDGIKLATRGDPRVTAVGAFLRRTSLDELPQFFNVLQGHMSIVGPRPHPIEINEAYMDSVDRYVLRHKVKPGITGWAQVNGLRGALDTADKMERRVQYDLYYIEHWSVWFDLRIVLMTFFKGFMNENAY